MSQPPKRRFRISFGWQILIAIALAIPLGLIGRAMGPTEEGPNWLVFTLQTIGDTFVTLLQVAVPPLVFLAIVTSIANLRKVTNAARLAWQTLLWFCITALISVGLALGLGLLTNPGLHTSVTEEQAAAPSSSGSWLDFLNNLVPANVLGLSADSSLEVAPDGTNTVSTGLEFNVLQIVILAIVVGIAALKVGAKAEPFLAFTESALEIVQKILWWVILLIPVGTLGLLGYRVADYGWDAISALGVFTLTLYVGLALVLFGLYPALLRLHGLSPLRYFAKAWPAIQVAFVSQSSVGTLPITQRVTERGLGVPREYASFAVPFGATTKMDGCAAVFPALSAIFIAQFYGIQLGITDYLLIVFVSVIGSAATAGITGATVMLTLTLSTLGLPLEGVGLLAAVGPILDMGRTAVNVAGQALVPVIVAKREGILDLDRYNAERGADTLDDEPAEGTEPEGDRVLATVGGGSGDAPGGPAEPAPGDATAERKD
nr:dicarboxylate/amino acid:cation symporter [Allonocardiopsis opalescens]